MKPLQQKKPTLITEEPVKVGTRLEISCDDGKVYTLNELGDILGLKPSTLRGRLKKYPWNSPYILKSIDVLKQDVYKKRATTFQRNRSKGPSAFSHLGCRARPENLTRMPEPTLFDQMCR